MEFFLQVDPSQLNGWAQSVALEKKRTRWPAAAKDPAPLSLLKVFAAHKAARAPVLGDNAYGINGEFRDGVRALGMEFFLQVDPSQLNGWAQSVALEKKRTRGHVAANVPAPLSLLKVFAAHKAVKWRPCSWKAADGQTRHVNLLAKQLGQAVDGLGEQRRIGMLGAV